MQSKTQVPPKLNFNAHVAIRLQNIDTPMMFIWFLLASRLSIKLHNAKHLRSACDTCSVSPPWTRTGILCFGSGPSKEYFLLKRIPIRSHKKISAKEFGCKFCFKEFVLKTLLQKKMVLLISKRFTLKI